MNTIVSTHHLTKRYGRTTAIDEVSMHVPQGAIYGLVGRQNAGKTVLLKLVSGLSEPTSGTVSFFGKSGRDRIPYFSQMGICIDSPGLYAWMSAKSNMDIRCLAAGLPPAPYSMQALTAVGLAESAGKRVRSFTAGMRQRLRLAMAMVGHPDLLVLDEPFSDLDPEEMAIMREWLLHLNHEQGVTCLIATHRLGELSKMATHYGILCDGRLLKEMTDKELAEECSQRIRMQIEDTRRACVVLEEHGITRYRVTAPDTVEIFERLQDSGSIALWMAQNAIHIHSISTVNQDLETYYLHLTGGDDHA